jgi:hypothetical protein
MKRPAPSRRAGGLEPSLRCNALKGASEGASHVPASEGTLDLSISATEGANSVDPDRNHGLHGSVSAGLRISFLP